MMHPAMPQVNGYPTTRCLRRVLFKNLICSILLRVTTTSQTIAADWRRWTEVHTPRKTRPC